VLPFSPHPCPKTSWFWRSEAANQDKYLLFPYDDSNPRERILSPEEIERQFPLAWTYLQSNETALRAREKGAFDNNLWYKFGRTQNIGKQKLRKLGIAQLVPGMRVFYDETGLVCLNNVRVNGIFVREDDAAWYLMGVLNSRVIDFVVRRISKPKERRPSGAYFEANKQYIAPLPIPPYNEQQKDQVIHFAKKLQRLHTKRRDVIDAINHRLASSQMSPSSRSSKWIWASVGDPDSWASQNPENLSGRKLKAWAKQKSKDLLHAELAMIQPFFVFGSTMCASFNDGELSFFVGNQRVVRLFVTENEAPIILAQWRNIARDSFVSDSLDAGAVISKLLDLKTTENAAIIQQIKGLNDELDSVENEIRNSEREMDDLVYALFQLSDEERRLIEADTNPRWNARIPAPPIP
jgi:hypothetical protein